MEIYLNYCLVNESQLPFRQNLLEQLYIAKDDSNWKCFYNARPITKTSPVYKLLDTILNTKLVEELNANHIIAGSDFVFGHNRAGGCDLLFKMGAELGFSFTPINPIESIEKKVYSSTNIRKYLELGALHKVKMNLGRYYSIQGRIAHGDKLGRKLGFPTANIFLGDHIRPKYGVYAVHLCFIDDSKKGSVNGVANIGIRPTIGGNNELLEVFIFNFKENIYGQRVKVDLIEYLRPEIKFNNLELMVAEMKRDIKRAKNLLKTKSND